MQNEKTARLAREYVARIAQAVRGSNEEKDDADGVFARAAITESKKADSRSFEAIFSNARAC